MGTKTPGWVLKKKKTTVVVLHKIYGGENLDVGRESIRFIRAAPAPPPPPDPCLRYPAAPATAPRRYHCQPWRSMEYQHHLGMLESGRKREVSL